MEIVIFPMNGVQKGIEMMTDIYCSGHELTFKMCLRNKKKAKNQEKCFKPKP